MLVLRVGENTGGRNYLAPQRMQPMERTLALLALAAVNAPLIAQPVIVASENQPVIGDAVTVNVPAASATAAMLNTPAIGGLPRFPTHHVRTTAHHLRDRSFI